MDMFLYIDLSGPQIWLRGPVTATDLAALDDVLRRLPDEPPVVLDCAGLDSAADEARISASRALATRRARGGEVQLSPPGNDVRTAIPAA